jgi:hypothetical protein
MKVREGNRMTEKRWRVGYRFRSKDVCIESARMQTAVTPHIAHFLALGRLRALARESGCPFASIEILSV